MQKYIRIEQSDGCYFDQMVDDTFDMGNFIASLRLWRCYISPTMYIRFDSIIRCVIIQQPYNVQKEKMN
jgi:hypothetical protein